MKKKDREKAIKQGLLEIDSLDDRTKFFVLMSLLTVSAFLDLPEMEKEILERIDSMGKPFSSLIAPSIQIYEAMVSEGAHS